MIEKLLRAIGALSPFLAAYPTWVRVVFALWVLLSAVLLLSFLLARSSPPAFKGDTGAEVTPLAVAPPTIESRQALRSERNVRRLRDLENDLRLEQLPEGVYGFVVPWSIAPDMNPSVSQNAGGTAVVELHKLTGGEVHVLGFVSQKDALKIETGAGAESVLLFPKPWEEAGVLASVAASRIGSANNRSFRDSDLIDIRLLPR